jgi:nitrous oxide reductase accessory protein NosL
MLHKIILVLLVTFSLSNAKMFQTVALEKATITQKGKDKIYCTSCGMHLGKFYKTNHVHKDHQYCSMHCLVENTKNGDIPKDAKVVDVKSLKFIDARKAFYVVGSSKKGTMTMNSKYAFANEKDAEAFSDKHGGFVSSFEEAYKEGIKDFKQDMMMIGKKRGKKVYKKGKKLYSTKCQKIDVNKFSTISKLKASIRDTNTCGKNLKDGQYQAIVVYLWDIEKLGKSMTKATPIAVPKKAKCPVCGMFVAKYPKWVAKLEGNHVHYFDGVKDMMKFIQEKGIKADLVTLQVTDYYTINGIKAVSAFYVVGSNVYGPMGNELIPFSNMNKAKQFSKNHGGKIYKFQEITKELVESLDK